MLERVEPAKVSGRGLSHSCSPPIPQNLLLPPTQFAVVYHSRAPLVHRHRDLMSLPGVELKPVNLASKHGVSHGIGASAEWAAVVIFYCVFSSHTSFGPHFRSGSASAPDSFQDGRPSKGSTALELVKEWTAREKRPVK
jgi:hypothetical protein